MNTSRRIFAAFIAVCFTAVAAFAADASPDGTWKWTQPGRNGGEGFERSVVFAMKDGKLTGTLKGFSTGQFEVPDMAIEDGAFKDGTISFSVSREFNGNKFTTKYSGKLEGDKITGSSESPGRGGGAPRKAEWVATRSK